MDTYCPRCSTGRRWWCRLRCVISLRWIVCWITSVAAIGTIRLIITSRCRRWRSVRVSARRAIALSRPRRTATGSRCSRWRWCTTGISLLPWWKATCRSSLPRCTTLTGELFDRLEICIEGNYHITVTYPTSLTAVFRHFLSQFSHQIHIFAIQMLVAFSRLSHKFWVVPVKTISCGMSTATTNSASKTDCVILPLWTFISTVTDATAVDTSLIFIVSQCTVKSRKFAQLISLKLILAFW